MNITVKGNADQSFSVPDPVDLSALTARVKTLEDWVAAHQTQPTPTPSPLTPYSKLYSPTSVWNKKLSTDPIHSNSVNLVKELSAQNRIAAPWVNIAKPYGEYSTGIYWVDATTPKKPVFLPSKPGSTNDLILQKGVPIPPTFQAATGTDGHACVIDVSADIEYNFWQLKWNPSLSRWESSDAGIIPNVSTDDGRLELYNQSTKTGWNCATATHLPLFGGTITLPELAAGVIPHALRIAITRARKDSGVWPAQTSDGDYTGLNAISEGQRFRFPANITIDTNWTPLTKMLVTAIRDYGLVVTDKSSGNVLFVEDPTQYGKTGAVLDQYMGGRNLWDIVGSVSADGEFPWSKLQALQ